MLVSPAGQIHNAPVWSHRGEEELLQEEWPIHIGPQMSVWTPCCPFDSHHACSMGRGMHSVSQRLGHWCSSQGGAFVHHSPALLIKTDRGRFCSASLLDSRLLNDLMET